MDIRKIGSRGTLVTYTELLDTEFACTSNIYLIDERVIIDTFLGPEIMAKTFRLLEADPGFVKSVINTHSDWDHIWGNSFFDKASVIAHETFMDLVEYPDGSEFQELKKYARGEISIRTPDITFDSKLFLKGAGLELFHTPGHTGDSISVYDEKDKVLIAGDNCEKPIPSYISPLLLEAHRASLMKYLEYDFDTIIPGHGEVLTREDLLQNIQYLQDLIDGDEKKLRRYEEGDFKLTHLTNQVFMQNR